MTRMLAKARPNHKGPCKKAGRGCTCYLYPRTTGRKAHVLRRRAQRHREKAQLRNAS